MAENQTQGTAASNSSDQPTGLTPEQIRQVVDKVYALLLKDLKIERERSRKR